MLVRLLIHSSSFGSFTFSTAAWIASSRLL